MSCVSSMHELYNAINKPDPDSKNVKIQMSDGISTLKDALANIYQKIVDPTNKNKLILVDGENLYNRLKNTKAGEGEKIRGENALADYKKILTELNKKEGHIVVVASHFYLFEK